MKEDPQVERNGHPDRIDSESRRVKTNGPAHAGRSQHQKRHREGNDSGQQEEGTDRAGDEESIGVHERDRPAERLVRRYFLG
jgi:hypothetical protein